MTWLGLSIAVNEAGGQFALVGSRHAARLRGAISGKNKTDVIDADVLARAGDVFELTPLRLPSPPELALRRLCVRRGAAVIDGNRYLRRLLSLARWAFPDVWNAFATSMPTAKAVLGRWPHLSQLATARRSALTAVWPSTLEVSPMYRNGSTPSAATPPPGRSSGPAAST